MIFDELEPDANKKVNGRKRQLLFNTDGRIQLAYVPYVPYVRAPNKPDGNAGLNFSLDILCQNNSRQKRQPTKEESVTRIKVVHDALGALATGPYYWRCHGIALY